MNLGWLNKLKAAENMLLGYIYNDFIVNQFLKHSTFTCQENLRGHVKDSNVTKQLI